MKKSGKVKKTGGRRVFADTSERIGSLIYGLFEFALLTVSCIGGILSDDANRKARRQRGEKSESKSVPTEDRIAIPKRVVKECRREVSARDAGLTGKEKSDILRFRRGGCTIKDIAKRIHRRDSTVSAFLSGHAVSR